eukprot:2266261-Amphidinium_carterae.3
MPTQRCGAAFPVIPRRLVQLSAMPAWKQRLLAVKLKKLSLVLDVHVFAGVDQASPRNKQALGLSQQIFVCV